MNIITYQNKNKGKTGRNASELHRMSARSYRNQQTTAMTRATIPSMMKADIRTAQSSIDTQSKDGEMSEDMLTDLAL